MQVIDLDERTPSVGGEASVADADRAAARGVGRGSVPTYVGGPARWILATATEGNNLTAELDN